MTNYGWRLVGPTFEASCVELSPDFPTYLKHVGQYLYAQNNPNPRNPLLGISTFWVENDTRDQWVLWFADDHGQCPTTVTITKDHHHD